MTDTEGIEMWRVDMQRALGVLDSAQINCNAKLQWIEEGVMNCLAAIRDMECSGGAEQMQCRQFVNEAADLAKNIRQSMAQYDFEYDITPGLSNEDVALAANDLKKYKIIDSRTGSLLRSSASPIAGPDGRVGEALFVVHPAFVRNATDSSQKIVLVKSTIVARFDEPVPARGMRN